MGHRAGWRLRAGGTALLILFGGPLRAEKKPPVPTFAAGVDIVSLNLVVTDVSGRQLPSLGADDISLFEDGVPQQISLFAQEEWPLRLSILLDSSGSMGAALPVAKRAATRLVRTLRPGDEAQVAQFSRRLDLLQESTDDQDALERAINRIVPQAETALYDALYITLKDLTREGGGDDLFRRAIIVLSDGEDTASMVIDEQLLDLARRAGVVVYSVGLLTPPVPGRSPESLPTYILTALARETGGRAYFPKTLAELELAYDRIARELRTLYGVGYVSQNPRPDGGFRRITIRTRLDNLLVRHRSGYYASAGEGGSALRAAPR